MRTLGEADKLYMHSNLSAKAESSRSWVEEIQARGAQEKEDGQELHM